VEILAVSGEREAELTFRGLAAVADVRGRLLAADIGGGSTELIVASDGLVEGACSLRLGSGRLTDRWVRHNPPTWAEIASCRQDAATRFAAADLPLDAGRRLVVVGGTGEYLMRLLPGPGPATVGDVEAVLRRLTGIPAATLAATLRIPEARARVLPAGVAIVAALCDLVAPAAISGARSGIRLGLLRAVFAGEV
jgi:exopolyphosphatase/guanosine-5'-triphosphate,3'-diphosphate pyrophosphatase